MVLPDVNLLIHAYNSGSPVHARARAWWERTLSDPAPVGLGWAAVLGFLRIATHPKILDNPLTPDAACRLVESWLGQPQVLLVHPGTRHAATLFGLLRRLGTAGNLTTDAHLAALAIEHQAELNTTDTDFARFPGLRWRNPIAEEVEP
jgi:toxin-antitoxin system PIN domain toxin